MQLFNTVISVDELQSATHDRCVKVVDCRFDLLHPEKGYGEFLAGHIPGAVYANLDTDLADPVRRDSGRHPLPDPDRLSGKLGSWGISNSSQVVAYDHSHGAIAARLWWLLRWLGHDKVAVLSGGMQAWLASGGACERGPGVAAPANFAGKEQPNLVVTTAELAADPDAILLVDARDRQRFLGRNEPIDPIAGHIPGARNMPFTEAVGADGRFLDPVELRGRWDSTLGNAAEAPWAAMCGSGVTACHLVLSAAVAGIRPPRLYVGSWSEWIRDTKRPIATG